MTRSHGAIPLLLLLLLAGCNPFAPEPAAPTPLPPVAGATVLPGATPGSDRSPINLQHLNFLVEDVTIAGQPMAITHIYSEFPKYEWVDASGEGIAALDDAARAAVVYLTAYERRPDPAYLDKARRLLNFAVYLQAPDGQFYNFITDRQGTINRTGNTSYLSTGWWAARAMWALGTGYRVFAPLDAAYAADLQRHFALGRDAWVRGAQPLAGQSSPVHGIPVPGWLVNGGADVTAIAVLGLLEMDAASGGQDAGTRALLTQFADGLAQYQIGNGLNYPWGMHPDSAAAPFAWHAWGSAQAWALARAGKQVARPDWVASARKEADLFFTRFVAGPMVSEWGVLPETYPQIAYGIDSLTQAFLAVGAATGAPQYAQEAGLTAAWFFGNNAAGTAMYDPATGRGYDGLQGSNDQRVNRNAGAESTIEALMALLAVQATPAAARLLPYRAAAEPGWQVLQAEDAQQTRGDAVASYRSGTSTGEAQWSNGHYLQLTAADAARLTFHVPAAGPYYLYAAYLRQQAAPRPYTAEAIQPATPPVIDGRLDEWAATQPLSATQALNVLRGTAGWGGAAKDSFVGYLGWDADNLYVAARVFSPEHRQAETGPSVWKGDVLWIYLDSNNDHAGIDSKLTLAQTPQGPQVWDWKSGFFVPGAKLAWQQETGSYTYEAALPWKSLNVKPPQAGTQMGIELGRACCGSGFMDLGGKDPDVASNLVPLTLVKALTAGSTAQTVQASGPDAVALRWAVDGVRPGRHVEGGAPDRNYLFLERLAAAPLDLTAGDHTLDLEYAGSDPTRAVELDGFLLLPPVLHKTLADSAGHQIQLTYELDGGALTIREAGP